MLPGNLVPQFPTITLSSIVTVGGEVIDAVSWSVERNVSHLPADAGVNGELSAKGELVPSTSQSVLQRAASPWTRLGQWPPAKGTPVTIEVTDGTTTWPVFTGNANSPSGDTTGNLTVDLIERVYSFTRKVRTPALAYKMPVGPEGTQLGIGNHHAWHISRAMEIARYYTTGAPLPGVRMMATMQGSTWPSTGTLVASSVYGIGAYEWGVSMAGPNATWTIAGAALTDMAARIAVPSFGGNTGVVQLIFETAAKATVAVLTINAGTRQAGLNVGGSTTSTLTGVDLVVAVSRTGNTWKISAGSQSATLSKAASSIARVRVGTSGASTAVGGICVADYSGGHPSADVQPTGRIGANTYDGAPNALTALDASPSVWDIPASEAIEDICDATGSHFGLDEYGNAWVIPTIYAMGAPSVRTLSDDVDLLGPVQWSQDWQSSASQVVSQFLIPTVAIANTPVIELWRGSGTTIAPGQTVTDFVTVDDSVDWIAPEITGLHVANPVSGPTYWHRAGIGEGTVLIGAVDVPGVGSNPDDERPCAGNEYSGTIEFLTPTSYKFTRTATSTVAVTEHIGNTANWAGLNHTMQGSSTPIIRGMGLITWGDAWVNGPDHGGDAQLVTHDAGKWPGQHQDQVVAWMDQYLTGDRVVLQQQPVLPDPRLQLADMVTLHLTTLDVDVDCMVIGKTMQSSAAGPVEMSLNLLAWEANQVGNTWRSVSDYYAGKTFEEVSAALSGDTFSQVSANPKG